MKKRNPWNRVETQVYSLATLDKKSVLNMNIMTYVTPISMKPKRYLLAIYRGTKTHENIFENKNQKYFLMQGLSEGQIKLVNVLGKKSGKNYNKEKYLEKQDIESYCYKNCNFKYLKNSGFVILFKIEKYILLEEHDLVIAKVEKVVVNNHGLELLDTEDLIEAGVIL